VWYDLRKYSFCFRIVNMWNNLPNDMVEADTINTFKNRLDEHWSNQDVLFSFHADFTGTGSLPVCMRLLCNSRASCVHWLAMWRFSIVITNCPLSERWSRSPCHVTSKFWEISDDVSEAVQDRRIVTMEDLTGVHVWHESQWPWVSLKVTFAFCFSVMVDWRGSASRVSYSLADTRYLWAMCVVRAMTLARLVLKGQGQRLGLTIDRRYGCNSELYCHHIDVICTHAAEVISAIHWTQRARCIMGAARMSDCRHAVNIDRHPPAGDCFLPLSESGDLILFAIRLQV